MTMRGHESRRDELKDTLGSDAGQVGPDSAGQSGDTQALSATAEAADESVEELAETGQAYEAGIIAGVEDAGDHPNQPVRTHEDRRESVNLPLSPD
jgi:hypothetical protein